MRMHIVCLITLALTGCATLPTEVTVSDRTIYYLKEADANEWVDVIHFLTQATATMTSDEWNVAPAATNANPNPVPFSEGKACMALSDWAAINTLISAFCSAPHINCSYVLPSGQTVKQAFNSMFMRLQLASGHSFRQM